MIRRFLVFIALLAAPLSAAFAVQYGPYEARLIGVVDGDTYDMKVFIWPKPAFEPPLRIRLANADTPEVAGAPACEQALAARATSHARMLLVNAKIIQIIDVSQDSFGRTLARVLIDGVDLGELLNATEYGRPYKRGDTTPWCVP